MQDQPENADTLEGDEQSPLSSEAPDTVESAQPAPGVEIPTQGSEDPQDLLAAAQQAQEPREAESAAEAAGEQPDGEVVDQADDLLADASAVDPKIDIPLLEAYLFSTHSPLTPGRLAELFNLESTKPVRKAIRLLNEQYEQTRRCFRVEQVAGGFQLLTLPDYGEALKALHQREQDAKLTKAALETLAIIAYKQPILRADLESIRGVASGETIRSLMEKHLVKIAGRAEEPGRPILYGTTKRFLEVFGLNSLKDLPQPEGLPTKAQQKASALLAGPDEKPQETQADVPATSPSPETAPQDQAPAPADETPKDAPPPDAPEGASAPDQEAAASDAADPQQGSAAGETSQATDVSDD